MPFEPLKGPLNTLLIDCERGTLTVRHLVKSEWFTDDNGKREEVVRNPNAFLTIEHAPSLALVEDAYWRYKRGEYGIDFKVIVVDPISTLASNHLERILRKRNNVKDGEVAKNFLNLAAEQRDYGTLADNLGMVLNQYRSSRALTIFTSHERYNDDDVSRTKKLGPNLSAKLLGIVMDPTDDAFRMAKLEKEESIDGVKIPKGTHVLRMATSESMQTKIRIGVKMPFPDFLPNPDLQKVRNILQDYMADRFVIFGHRGAGKTAFACSFANPEIFDGKVSK